jgi:hypothetical protein
MRIKTALIGLVMLLPIGLFSGCPAQVKGPGIQFETEKYDFGTIPEGTIFNNAFMYTNNGTEALIIEGVLSTCSCTFVDGFDREVAPGKSGKITFSFNSAKLDGRVTRNIMVGTNVPDKHNITLTIEGNVKAAQ